MASNVEPQSLNPEARLEQANMLSKMSLRAGAVAGFAGALGVIAIVTIAIVISGRDLFTAPRLIASVLYGDMVTGFFPVIVGTGIHLVTGTLLGVGFAFVMPSVYRTMWMVAGLMYGMVAWAAATLVMLPLVAPLLSQEAESHFMLLVAHMMFGFIIGMAGSTYGMLWKAPGENSEA